MAKSKPIDLTTGNRTKKEIENRKLQEERLKGNSNLIDVVPKWLCKEAKKEYKKIIKELKNSNILTNIDIPIVAIVADAYVKMYQADMVIQKEGMFIKKISDRGAENLVEHPATKIYKQYNSIYKQYLMELGLSPSSRAKLSIINSNLEEEKEDALLAILNS